MGTAFLIDLTPDNFAHGWGYHSINGAFEAPWTARGKATGAGNLLGESYGKVDAFCEDLDGYGWGAGAASGEGSIVHLYSYAGGRVAGSGSLRGDGPRMHSADGSE